MIVIKWVVRRFLPKNAIQSVYETKKKYNNVH